MDLPKRCLNGIINFFDGRDKKFSQKIHEMKTSWFMELILCVPLYSFSPMIIPFNAYLMNLLFSAAE